MKHKNILLVEPPYKTIYPSLGLMKISTWLKKKGHNVDFVKHDIIDCKNGFLKGNYIYSTYKKKYDEIYITSLFTYYFNELVDTVNFYRRNYKTATIKVGGIAASLNPDLIYEKTGIKPHIGLMDKKDKAEYCNPDYSLYSNLDYSITFTSRGCKNKCAFCCVSKHEPEFIVKDNWIDDINMRFSKIIFWDNNWFQSPNLCKDIRNLHDLKSKGIKNIDFNQGLDCRLFTKEIAKELKGLPISPLRFAFDNITDDGFIQRAIELARENEFKDIRVYVLYNSMMKQDTPKEFYYRIKEINKLAAASYPMRFMPLTSLNLQQCYNHLSNNWEKDILRAIKLTLMFYYSEGLISDKRDAFKDIYGNSFNTFYNKMKMIYQSDKERINKKGI